MIALSVLAAAVLAFLDSPFVGLPSLCSSWLRWLHITDFDRQSSLEATPTIGMGTEGVPIMEASTAMGVARLMTRATILSPPILSLTRWGLPLRFPLSWACPWISSCRGKRKTSWTGERSCSPLPLLTVPSPLELLDTYRKTLVWSRREGSGVESDCHRRSGTAQTSSSVAPTSRARNSLG